MKFFLTLLLLVLLIIAAAAAVLYLPFGPPSETFVDIAPGSSTHAIAVQLQRAGILRTQYAFAAIRLRRTFTGEPLILKAGEYRFDHPATPQEIFARIARGDVYSVALTIPEGYNLFDISQAVETAHLGSASDFLAAARQHTELIAAWFPAGSPQPASLEGYLFPDTYHFSRHATPLQMLTAMVHRFHRELSHLGANGQIPSDVPRTVLMASLIEKEVSQDSERPLVAGVFNNRLARGIPLATDPTVIYAALLDGRWRGTIYASDLQSPSPYNTYKHPGLPPGPICNPGLAALRAAIHPASTDFLYFVADANGHSRFSTGLKEHDAQVQAYRNAIKSP
jgi:UPF0755 protein